MSIVHAIDHASWAQNDAPRAHAAAANGQHLPRRVPWEKVSARVTRPMAVSREGLVWILAAGHTVRISLGNTPRRTAPTAAFAMRTCAGLLRAVHWAVRT
jgi:hypothetical protein